MTAAPPLQGSTPPPNPAGRSLLQFGDFIFEPEGLDLRRDGQQVPVPLKSLKVLACLLESPGRVVLKEDLLETVWPGTFVSDASLAQAVSQLRQALDDSPNEPRFIQTVHRRGYRFLKEVQGVDTEASGPQGPEPLPQLAPVTDLGSTPTEPAPQHRLRTWVRWIAAAVLLLAAGRLLVTVMSPSTGPEAEQVPSPIFLSLDLKSRGYLDAQSFTVSPDGSTVVFSAYEGQGSRLFFRRLHELESLPIAGTEGAYLPSFAPDGRVGFLADGKVKVVALTGEAQEIIGPLPASGTAVGLALLEDGSAILAQYPFGGLWRVAQDREPQQLTDPQGRGGLQHLAPLAIPGGRWVAYTAWGGATSHSRIEALDLSRGRSRVLLDNAHSPHVTSSGVLVYVRGRELTARRFDPRTLDLTSAPKLLFDKVAVNSMFGIANLAVGGPDTVVFLPARVGQDLRRLALIGDAMPGARSTAVADSDDKRWVRDLRPLALEPRHLRGLAVSRNGRRLVMAAFNDGPRNRAAGSDLWVADLDGAEARRLTFGSVASNPVLTPDGREVIFTARKEGRYNLFRKPTDGQGPAVRLLSTEGAQFAHSWAPDGRTLVYYAKGPNGDLDLWTVDLGQTPLQPSPLLQGPGDAILPHISPDGRWLAYCSNESGQYLVYVRPYPDIDSGLWLVSGEGAGYPQWSQDSRSLYFSSGPRLYEVEVEPSAGITFSPPTLLFEHRSSLNWYQLLPDEQILTMDRIEDIVGPEPHQVALGWLAAELGPES